MKKKEISRPARHKYESDIRHRINYAREVLKSQSKFFRRHFGAVESEFKSDVSRITFADIAISENINKLLIENFPKDNFCSEEMDAHSKSIHLNGDFSWLLDPVDGTNNFALGFPMCSISLSLLHEGFPIYGMVYDYSIDSIIEGGEGFGLFHNGKSLKLHDNKCEIQRIIGIQFPINEKEESALRPLLSKFKVRAIGSSVIMSTLSAKGYLFGIFDNRPKVWDLASGYAFAKAVGKPFNFIKNNPFPLESFHPALPQYPYFSGKIIL